MSKGVTRQVNFCRTKIGEKCQNSVSEISRFFDLENARLKMDDLEISRDLEIGQLTY